VSRYVPKVVGGVTYVVRYVNYLSNHVKKVSGYVPKVYGEVNYVSAGVNKVSVAGRRNLLFRFVDNSVEISGVRYVKCENKGLYLRGEKYNWIKNQ
jgi:hypothetical protein